MGRARKFRTPLILSMALPGVGIARSTMNATVPTNDAIVATVPEHLKITFEKRIRLTKVSDASVHGDPSLQRRR